MKKELEKNKRLFILLGVLIVLAIVAIIIRPKKDTEEEEPPVTDPPSAIVNINTGRYANLTELKDYLSSYIATFSNCDSGIDLDFSKKEVYTPSDLDKNTIYQLAFNYLVKNKKTTFENTNGNNITSFKKSDLEEAIVSLFGSSYAKDFSIDDTINYGDFEYTLSNDTYSGPTLIGGCTNKKSISNYLIAYEARGDVFSLMYATYWLMIDENGIVKYSIDSSFDEPTTNLDELRLQNAQSFNFELEGNNYILKSITEIKNKQEEVK